jgi:hypothetical protein
MSSYSTNQIESTTKVQEDQIEEDVLPNVSLSNKQEKVLHYIGYNWSYFN